MKSWTGRGGKKGLENRVQLMGLGNKVRRKRFPMGGKRKPPIEEKGGEKDQVSRCSGKRKIEGEKARRLPLVPDN